MTSWKRSQIVYLLLLDCQLLVHVQNACFQMIVCHKEMSAFKGLIEMMRAKDPFEWLKKMMRKEMNTNGHK